MKNNLVESIKNLVSKRVYGTVEVLEIECDIHILITNLHQNFCYGYSVRKNYFALHRLNLELVVNDCLDGYREEILKRYIKGDV